MDQSLRDAAQQGSIDALYALIRTDPQVLDRIDGISFVDTPLHIAASAGHTLFAKEIMRLKPSFAKMLNQVGLTPIHLALQNNHTQLVHRLLVVDKDLVRVQGREGVTLLHYAAQTGNLKFLFLCCKVCPESIEDVTNRGENALHIALKYGRVEAFLLLLRMVWRMWLKDSLLLEEKLLNWQDEEGNTLLHVAVSKNLPKAVSSLLDTGLVDIKARNLAGHTVFDILEQHHALTQVDRQIIKDKLRQLPVRRLTARVEGLSLTSSFSEVIVRQYVTMCRIHTVITDEKLNALLVVGALLLTVTFQAALTPPKSRQNLFLLLNALTYCLTTFMLSLNIPPDLIGLYLLELLLLLFACFCVLTLVITTHHITFIVLSLLFGYTFFNLVYSLVLTFVMRRRQRPVKEFHIDQIELPRALR